MAEQRSVSLAPAAIVDWMEKTVREVAEAGLILRTADAGVYDGRCVQIGGRRLLNFAGCSYLGLEQRVELREAAIEAIRRYGTQLAISRAFLESPYYPELEAALGAMTGGHVVVALSTTLAHVSALPVVIGSHDAVLIDGFAHASLHTAIGLVHDRMMLTVVPGRMDLIEARVARLSANHERVWYVLDGLYSMSGEFARFDLLASILERYPKLHLYIDDAHATSWCGRNGRGMALDILPDVSRVVVALSLNKAFSAAGGAVVFPSEAMRERVRMCGGPLIFGGPVQPPMLAAAVASARLHLQPEFASLQQQLMTRIKLMRGRCRELGIPLATGALTPIVNIPCGTPPRTFALTRRLWDRGFFVSPAVPPAVSPKRSGLRITVSLLNRIEDIEAIAGALAEEIPPAERQVMAE